MKAVVNDAKDHVRAVSSVQKLPDLVKEDDKDKIVEDSVYLAERKRKEDEAIQAVYSNYV